MKKRWPADLIAIAVIAVTVVVAALGARGAAPLQVASTTLRGVVVPSDIQRPPHRDPAPLPAAAEDTVQVPSCSRRLTMAKTLLSFDCPDTWFVWENSAHADGGSPQSSLIVSNHRPLVEGGEGLPDGWFKVDTFAMTADGMTLDRLAREMCAAPPGSGSRVDSCGRTTIDGHAWVRVVTVDDLFHAKGIGVGTVVNGVLYQVSGIIPNGPSAATGTAEVEALLDSIRIG